MIIKSQSQIKDNENGLYLVSTPIGNLKDITLRAILRAAVYELLFTPDTPFKVVINEYINIAQSFYSEKEPEFLNAILDKVAKSKLTMTSDG